VEKSQENSVDLLKKQKYPFSKTETRKVKQVLSGGVVPVEGYKERVKEAECSRNLCTYV
jgi:hypothetical protein